jgi:hypothetical protein
MWLTIFTITVVAAMGLGAAAFLLQPKHRRVSLPIPGEVRWAGDLPLLRRMRALDLVPHDVSRSEPALFRQLEARCRDCDSKERCLRDLRDGPAGDLRSGWREYCPNGAILNMLTTLQGCRSGKAAPHGVL